MYSKFQSKLRVLDTEDGKQKTSLFSLQVKSALYVFMVFCFFVLYVQQQQQQQQQQQHFISPHNIQEIIYRFSQG